MTRAKEYACRVTNGLLAPEVGKALRAALKGLDGRWVVLSVREKKRARSSNQNRFYFGVILPQVAAMMREYGNDVDENEVHEFLKEHAGGLKRVVTDPAGVRRSVVKSSAGLTTTEFEAYLEKVRAWAAPFGLALPFPNESTDMQY